MDRERQVHEEGKQHTQPVPFNFHHHNDLVNLNLVLQKALLLFQNQVQNGNMIVRCDALPSVKGDNSQLLHAFQLIISGILNASDISVKQYLHIGCSEEKTEIMDLAKPAGHKNFQIDFRSNQKCKAAGFSNDAVLNQISDLLQQNNADFKLKTSEDESCFVTISISGKN